MGAGPQHTQQDAGGKAELGRTQVTAGSEERQPQVQLTAAVSTGQGPPPSWRRSAQGEVYPHHGGGQNKAAVSAGQGPPHHSRSQHRGRSALGGDHCGAGAHPHHGGSQNKAAVSTGWGPPPSQWQSARGGGPSPSAHGGGQCRPRVHPAHSCSQRRAGVYPRPSRRASGSGL